MKLQRSSIFAPGIYQLPIPEGSDMPLIQISGQDLLIDFNGAVLDGSRPGAQPDSFNGVAVRVENGRNITIKGLTARGYKVGLLARNVNGLHITGCDFSYNYRPRLKSTLEREDLTDWLSFHHNDDDQWLRFGAGIYLAGCDQAEVDHCTITGGQNGLLMTRCNEGLLWNNNFSFNSGVGLGLYRSSRNRVMHNRLDWNVRGYSHGVYHRGQDSAAILVYEQSCNNTFAYNSATHSGDGFFLWAGQTTMDTGQGGCNDNLIYCNDFSYAPTNGIEVTFSRNLIHGNRMEGCDHGVWGGYSYQSVIENNSFAENRIGIAIEHGQDNVIIHNEFVRDRTGIRLWQSAKQDPNWGYPKHRDTRSRDYIIVHNRFRDVSKAMDITGTTGVATEGAAELAAPAIERMRDGIDTALPPRQPRGRAYILVDEWGPYDFRSPKLWPREKLPDGRQRFEILGPSGKWKLVRSERVAAVSAETGSVPGEIIVTLPVGDPAALHLELEYFGAEVTCPFGRRTPAGQPYRFEFLQ